VPVGPARLFGRLGLDALAAILLREPEWSALPADTPPAMRELLSCLQKDAGQRLRDIGDARLAIDELLAGMDPRRSSVSGVLPAAPKRRFPRTAAIAAAAVAAVSIGAVLWWRKPRGVSGQTKSVAVLPFKALSGAPGGHSSGAASPSGERPPRQSPGIRS
jgi:hypothetical protein